MLGLTACSTQTTEEEPAKVQSTPPGSVTAQQPVKPAIKPQTTAGIGAKHNDKPLAPAVPGVTIRRVAVQDKVVALTFDDGPHAGLTPQVLDILRNNGVKATFFVQGSHAQAYPRIIRRMTAEGHEVGNHTWNHAYLSKVSRATAESQLQRTNDAIVAAGGVKPVIMRPPGGYTNAGVAAWARQRFGFSTILWDVDTNDWRKPGVSVVAARGINGAKPGSIILVHDIHASTVAAIDSMVKGLKNRGYELVTVSELIRRGKVSAAKANVKPAVPAAPVATPVAPVAPAVPAAPVTPAVTPALTPQTPPAPAPVIVPPAPAASMPSAGQITPAEAL